MSLLLTKTCEYAILVAVQQEHDICVQSKLELRLPAAVDDLIPPTTIISTPPTPISREGTVTFDTTLAYLISAKLLHRLRTYNAEITLTASSVSADAAQQRIGTLSLSVPDAKMVVHHGAQMDKVNRFVVDRGDWRSLLPDNRKEQLKAGLFIVSMPDKKSLSSSSSFSSSYNMELKSLMDLSASSSSNNTPLLFSDSVTTTTATTVLSSPSSHSFVKNTKQQQQKKEPTSALHRYKQIQQRQQKLKKADGTTAATTTDSVPRYHQIASGTTAFTFYFSIVHADGIKHLMPKPASGRRGVARKPIFAYTFLSQRISCPASSITKQPSKSWPTCFYLRGHLVDIQSWLNDQSFMEVTLQLIDEENDHLLFTKETVGLAHVPLSNLAFYRTRDACYEHKRKLGEEIGKVTVRLGLVSGW
ncbi:hypothetical protein BJV82DRAFT_501710, partial [Fennellomyces sp. T-0311]